MDPSRSHQTGLLSEIKLIWFVGFYLCLSSLAWKGWRMAKTVPGPLRMASVSVRKLPQKRSVVGEPPAVAAAPAINM